MNVLPTLTGKWMDGWMDTEIANTPLLAIISYHFPVPHLLLVVQIKPQQNQLLHWVVDTTVVAYPLELEGEVSPLPIKDPKRYQFLGQLLHWSAFFRTPRGPSYCHQCVRSLARHGQQSKSCMLPVGWLHATYHLPEIKKLPEDVGKKPEVVTQMSKLGPN